MGQDTSLDTLDAMLEEIGLHKIEEVNAFRGGVYTLMDTTYQVTVMVQGRLSEDKGPLVKVGFDFRINGGSRFGGSLLALKEISTLVKARVVQFESTLGNAPIGSTPYNARSSGIRLDYPLDATEEVVVADLLAVLKRYETEIRNPDKIMA
ncbi:hypothetical protein HYV81_02965 [Candidatus Woesearchaeota archaeon]|nr:hypothetical protein [Candidatus Woesearchaeota archaeon]